MSIEEIKLLIGLITEGLALIASIVIFGRKLYNSLRDKKLKAFIKEAMVEVEKNGLAGAIKKMQVLEKVAEKFGEGKAIYEKADKYIEDCIDFSKKVNNK